MIESRISEGLTHWPALAAGAGLPALGWQAELLNSRKDAEGDRLVLRMDHPQHGSLVVKQGFGAAGIRSVSAAVPAQQRAFALLDGSPHYGVPRILAAPADTGAVLMELAPGQHLAELVDQPGLPAALERAGAWLDAFHRASRVEERAFQPRFMVTHLKRLADEARDGRRLLPRPGKFAKAIEKLERMAAACEGARTVSALRHGDLNARNLLVGPDKAWGIDFSEAGDGPVGYDIARLLMHLAELSARPPSGDVLAPPLRRAFFSGYKLTRKRDGSLPFLFFARLLSDWASLNAKEEDLTLFKAIRLERIQMLVTLAKVPG